MFDITIINETYHADIISAASTYNTFLLATMWIGGTPVDGMCNHNHKLCILPEVKHVPFLVTLITPARNGLLAILPSLAIFPSKTRSSDFFVRYKDSVTVETVRMSRPPVVASEVKSQLNYLPLRPVNI
jgi:hypothetical protein